MTHHRAARVPGPDLTAPWAVLSGYAVIRGELPLILPAGATWPGIDHLDEDVLELVQPYEVWMTPGAATSPHTTPAGREAGAALVLALILARGTIEQRLALLDRTGAAIEDLHREVAGDLLGMSRESVSRLRGRLRRQHEHLPPLAATRGENGNAAD